MSTETNPVSINECARCGCQARTHPIETCRTFVARNSASSIQPMPNPYRADMGTETNPVSVDLDATRAQLAEWRAAWEAYMFDSVGAVVDVADTLIDEVERLRAQVEAVLALPFDCGPDAYAVKTALGITVD